jgi:hypothetical protein
MKKFSIFKIAFVVFSTVLISSCNINNKESSMLKLEKFVDQVTQNKSELTLADFDALDDKLGELKRDVFLNYRSEMSEEEIESVNTTIGKYKALKVKAGITKVKQEVKDAFQQGATIIQELFTDSI